MRQKTYASVVPNVCMSASATAVAAETIKEKPPSSGSGSVKHLREVDGIVSMCVSVLSREGNKKGLRTRRNRHGESREQEK